MKKQFLPLALLALSFTVAKAQQWSGPDNTSDTLSRTGSVIIGTPGTSSAGLSINAQTSFLKIGASSGNNAGIATIEFQKWILHSVNQSGNLLMSGPKGTLFVSNGGNTVFGNHLNWGSIGGGLKSKFAFDGEVGATKLFVSAPGGFMNSPKIPNGYLFSVNGASHIGGKMVIGDTTLKSEGNYRLFVQGGILTEKLKVAVANESDWADYVFAPSYKLKTLEEVEIYVSNNKHLPGVPSATEIKNEGLDVAKMDAKLLEKIEELTLYMIQLKKENNEVKKEIASLKLLQEQSK